jgi:hypothetical protein
MRMFTIRKRVLNTVVRRRPSSLTTAPEEVRSVRNTARSSVGSCVPAYAARSTRSTMISVPAAVSTDDITVAESDAVTLELRDYQTHAVERMLGTPGFLLADDMIGLFCNDTRRAKAVHPQVQGKQTDWLLGLAGRSWWRRDVRDLCGQKLNRPKTDLRASRGIRALGRTDPERRTGTSQVREP